MRYLSQGPLARAALAAIFLLCLSACITDDKRAGVDEFPNSIYARVNGFLDESKKSEGLGDVPSVVDTLTKGGAIHVAPAKIAAGKMSAAAANASNLTALAKVSAAPGCTSGTVTLTLSPVPEPLKTTVVTVTACTDAKFFDSIKDNETMIRAKSVATYKSGRVETAEISDADGDGIVNPVAGGKSKAAITFTGDEKGVVEKSMLIVGPGPDDNFDTEPDNLVYSSRWYKLSGNDTLGTASYTDVDGDSIAVDNGKLSLVDLEFYQKGPSADHPDAIWTRASLRMLVRYKVEAKTVSRVRFEMEDQRGRVSVGEVLALDGGRDFQMNNNVIAHFTTVGKAAGDSLDTLDVRLTMLLGDDFDSKADDKIFAIQAMSKQKTGDESRATFSFTSSKPILSGQDPENGDLSMEVEYADATKLKVDGKITAKVLDVTIEDRKGKRSHVIWDRAGEGISIKALN